MKILFLISTYLMLLDASCKHKNTNSSVAAQRDLSKAAVVDSIQMEEAVKQNSKTKGTVSHRYAPKGCAVVIDIKNDNGDNIVLIPHVALENKFDKEGLVIYFNYHTLKRVQPPGCETGMPAEITDISLQ